ncbi:TauD/TfdA family dioxygenase [Candidatus Puniceispirillum sp.]|nr:TauD/TfdA family dioxygenase [Alphaproteobacteria bacterium]MDC1294093.1 TauD/TfdA family dioxygenase [Candidatus Puniceispirillum sp.]
MPIFPSVLHWVHIPPVGGNTLWVDMVAVAEGRSAPMRHFLTGLTVRHTIQKGFSFVNENGQNDRVAELAETINQEKATNHPVLRKHPVSCAETLFVNAAFTKAINELAANESDAMLHSRIDNPRYQMRVKWRPETVVIWNNWATQHYACGDHYLSFRGVQRVTVSTPRYASLGLN